MGSDGRAFLSTVLALVLAAGGCGGSPAGAGGSTPEEAARAYVDAINARDGETVCGLLVDSAAHEFRIPDWGECPRVVSGFIGYQEDSGTDVFERARIVELREGEQRGELRSLRLRLEVEQESGLETVEDVLWLVEEDGSWRLARASGLLYLAFGGGIPEDAHEAPDLAAQEHSYEQEVDEEQEAEEAEQATFVAPEDEVFRCDGPTTSYEDASGDLHFEGDRGLTPAEASRYATADVRRVEVGTEGDDLCARFTLGGGEIEEHLVIRFDIYSPKQNATHLGPELELMLEVRADGRARLAYEDLSEEDEYGRNPLLPVAGQVGRDGDTFALRVARRDLLELAGDRPLPDWDGFLWGGITFYLLTQDGARRAVSDDVHGYLAMVSHPGGRVYESGERQTRDLPTD
jgi:hypothetical protein